MLKKHIHKSLQIACLIIIHTSTTLANSHIIKNKFISWAEKGNYFGVSAGYGKANWWAETGKDKLTEFYMAKNSSSTSNLAYGMIIGKEISSWASIQAEYKHFPDTKLSFDSNFILPTGDPTESPNFSGKSILSRTSQYDLLSKLQFPVYRKIYLYTLIGASYTTRKDVIADLGGYGFSFGFGASKSFSHLRAGVDFNYVTGESKIVADSIKYYVPFTIDTSFNISFVS